MSLKKKMKRYFNKKNKSPKNNRKIVGIILFSMAFAMFFLFVIQLSKIAVIGKVNNVSLAEKTKQLYQGSTVVKAKRGTIYDRNGIAIAEDATSYSAYATLSKTYTSGNKKLYAQEKDFEKLVAILAKEVSGFDEKKALTALKNGAKENLWLVEFSQAKNLTLKQRTAIEADLKAENLVGIYFNESQARMYPNGEFASHLIGYTDLVENKSGEKELVGKMGIESAYDDILKGTNGKIVYQRDNYQNPLPGTVSESVAAKDGKDIYTTLDSRLQVYLEKYMKEYYEKLGAKSMTAMLVKANTGEILALDQQPSFDPETKKGLGTDYDSNFNWANTLVEDPYEPGSTMKILTTAAAITQGVYDPNETYQGGKIEIADATIDDWDHGEKGTLTMRQALSWSSNKGMVILEQKMPDAWRQYLKKFGFGQSTYSGLANEKSGTLPSTNIVDTAMSSFGQSIGVTNFQMMQAFTAIANNGTMLKPQYITKIVNPNTNKITVMEPEVVGNPVTKESTEQVREYMRDTTENEEYGIAYGKYSVPGYHVSVKTGTAQISENGAYLTGANDYIYSAVSIVPSENPEYIFYLTIKQPKNYDYNELSDITNAILKRAMDLTSSDATTDGESTEISTEKITVDDYRNLSTTTAATAAQKSGLDPVVLGEGSKVKSQSIDVGKTVLPGEKLLLLTNDDAVTMPDITGWSKTDIVKLADLLNIDVTFEGEGYATSQSIEAYATIRNQKLTIVLKEN